MRIFLLISYFDEVGGSEEQLTVLAAHLKQAGHSVTVFTRLPVNKNSQYVQRLIKNHVRIIAPPKWFADLLGDWYFQDRVVQTLGRAAFPFFFPAALTIGLIKKKLFNRSLQSMTGYFRSLIGKLLYADRREALLTVTLNLWTLFYRPHICHVFRFDLHRFLSWAAHQRIPSVYYELITPDPNSVEERQAWNSRKANINQATLIHAISQSTADIMRRDLEITRPIDVVYPFLKDIPEMVSIRKENKTSPFTITTIARLAPEKGISDLLLAAKKLLQIHPQIQFLIAGSGPLKEVLAAQAEALGISSQVTFYGSFPRQELSKIMAVTDIFVLPSYIEGLPLVIIEAMVYGKPVVSTDVGGVYEVVDDQRTGLIVPQKNPAVLAQALLRLIEDEPLREKMGQAGREKVLSGDFSVKAYIAHELLGYQKAIRISHSPSTISAVDPKGV